MLSRWATTEDLETGTEDEEEEREATEVTGSLSDVTADETADDAGTAGTEEGTSGDTGTWAGRWRSRNRGHKSRKHGGGRRRSRNRHRRHGDGKQRSGNSRCRTKWTGLRRGSLSSNLLITRSHLSIIRCHGSIIIISMRTVLRTINVRTERNRTNKNFCARMNRAPGLPTLPSQMTGLMTKPAQTRERSAWCKMTKLTVDRTLRGLTSIPQTTRKIMNTNKIRHFIVQGYLHNTVAIVERGKAIERTTLNTERTSPKELKKL